MAETVNIVKPHVVADFSGSSVLTIRSVVIPCLFIASANAYRLWNEHWEHWEHLPPLEERPEYPYMNIRTKNYPWGDGDKVSRLSNAMKIE